VEKRNRPPVSCEPCRSRKYLISPKYCPRDHRTHVNIRLCRLKCNRGLPCDACTRRGKPSLCSYANNAHRSISEPSKARDLKDRLSTLENLVSSVLSGNAVIQPRLLAASELTTESSGTISSSKKTANASAKQSSTVSSSSGGEDTLTPETPHIQETGNGQVNYIDPSHWLSVLDDIKEVREHLSVSNQLSVSNRPISEDGSVRNVDRLLSDPSFLFSSDQKSTLDEILPSLPSQPICDMLLSWYFNSRFMVLGEKRPSIASYTKPLI
jgi:hypothetical protein